MTTQASKPVWRSPIVPWAACSPERREIVASAWAHGELSYKLSPEQRSVYDIARRWSASKNRMGRTFVFDIGRRWGKSSMMSLMAFEDALRHPGWRIPYYGPIKKDLMRFIEEHLGKLLTDCPPELAPKWVKSEETYRFQNGARIEYIGLDVNPDGARGGGFDATYLDEAGFFDNLENVMTSVLFPQMMGRPHARMYAGSTPPMTPSHYWSQEVVPVGAMEGACVTRTIDDSDLYDEAEKEEFIRKMGGRKSSRCRRELFTEHVTDEELAIIPEFREVEKEVVVAIEPPYWRDCYTAMDPGWKDMTAVLFGYWNFEGAFLYIEDEVAAPRLNSAAIAEQIKAKELVLWSGSTTRKYGATKPQPFMRVSDIDPRLLYDLANDHQLTFAPTAKDNLDQQINSVRVAFSDKKIRIHPRCKMLRLHLKNAIWKNEARKVFAREGGHLGHFDTLAALIYMWRNVQKTRNPAPKAQAYVAGDLKVKENVQTESKWSRRGGRLFFKGGR